MIPKFRIMRRQTVHTTQRARRPLGLVLAGAIFASALAPTAAGATEGRPPEIVSTGSGIGGEVTVSAQINPEGLETSYEIKLACSACAPAGYSPAAGTLPAVNESRTVTLNLTGIKSGTYGFEVRASNTAGYTSRSGEFTVPEVPPGACPDGCSNNEPYKNEVSEQAERLGKELAEGAPEREHQRLAAKEQEEQKKAAETAARYAAEEPELKQAEEHEAQQAAARERTEREEQEAEHPACIVPALKGDTLTAARHALAKAHCRLGAIHRPARRHGTLHVSAQGAPAGEQLSGGARVALWCRAKQAPHGGGRGR